MITLFIVGITFSVIIALWTISTQKKLALLEENIKGSMAQIGVQLSSRFDALFSLLDLTKGYAKFESEILLESLSSKRSLITAKSTPEDILNQEKIISEALAKVAIIAEKHPELKANQNYIITMGAVDTFENMLRTSHLVYNESVKKLNHEISLIPVFMLASIAGFFKKDYLDSLHKP